MKVTAPFTPAQVRAAKIPLCPKRNDGHHAHNLAPWATLGAMTVTQMGAVCPKCGHVIEDLDIDEGAA